MPRHGPNKWRYRGDGGDGVEDYQCLRCGGLFALRVPCLKVHGDYVPERAARFCPLCGTRWEGEHVNVLSPGRARRPADRAYWPLQERERAAPLWFEWRIEVRFAWPFSTPAPAEYREWTTVSPAERRMTAADLRREMWVELDVRREDEAREVRARLIPGARPKLPA